MTKNFLVSINMNQNEIQNGIIQNLSVSPSNPKNGQIYYDTTLNKFGCYENNEWVYYVSLDEFNTQLALKANKDEVTSELNKKADKENTYTKDEVDGLLEAKDSLPPQEGNANKFLTTNGTEASWANLPEASTSVKGIVKLATPQEISEGTSSTSVITVNQLETSINELSTNLNEKIELKADKSTTYTKDDVDDKLDLKADLTTLSNYYTKTDTDGKLALKADKADTLAGYGITDAYTKAEVDGKISSVYKFKGSVASVDALPSSDNVIGDVYNVEDTGANYAWDGKQWDKLSETIDLTPYLTKDEAGKTYETITNVQKITTDVADLTDRVDTLEQLITDTPSAIKKMSKTNPLLTPQGGVATWSIDHLYGEDAIVQIKDMLTNEEVFADVILTNNNVTIKFNATEDVTVGKYKAIIIG